MPLIIWNPQSELIREPNLLIPGKKPTGPVKIDWSHPLAKGLVGCWLFNTSRNYKDLTGTNDGTEAGTGTAIEFNHDQNGVSVLIPDDNTTKRIDLGAITSTNPLSGASNPLSMYSYLRMPATANNTYPRIIDKSDGGSASNGWTWYVQSTTTMVLQIGGSSLAWTISDDGTYGVGISAKIGRQRGYQEGDFLGSYTSTVPFSTTTTNAALLNWNHGPDRQWEDRVYCIYVWDRFLSDAEHAEIHADRYQFLIPA